MSEEISPDSAATTFGSHDPSAAGETSPHAGSNPQPDTYSGHKECWLCYDAEFDGADEAPLLPCGCVCKGTSTRYAHVPCLLRNARIIWEEEHTAAARGGVGARKVSKYNPWLECPTCRKEFTGQVRTELIDKEYEIYGDGAKGNILWERATVLLAKECLRVHRFVKAEELYKQLMTTQREKLLKSPDSSTEKVKTSSCLMRLWSFYFLLGSKESWESNFLPVLKALLGSYVNKIRVHAGFTISRTMGTVKALISICDREGRTNSFRDVAQNILTAEVSFCLNGPLETATHFMGEALSLATNFLGDEHELTSITKRRLEEMVRVPSPGQLFVRRSSGIQVDITRMQPSNWEIFWQAYFGGDRTEDRTAVKTFSVVIIFALAKLSDMRNEHKRRH